MGAEWPFGRKLAAGFAVTVIAFVVVAITGARTVRVLIENDEWVAHTDDVRVELALLVSELVSAETAERGYVLTGEDRFLVTYRVAVTNVDTAYNALLRLTADNPNQQHRMPGLRQRLDDRITEFGGVIDARRQGGLEGGAARVVAAHGQELTERIQRAIGEMDSEELSLLGHRRQEAKASADEATAVILWGGVVTVVVTIAIGLLLSRALVRRIGSAVRHVQTSSAELQTAANQQADAAREQASALTEIATTMTELLASSRQISDSASQVAKVASQAGQAARDGQTIGDKGDEATAQVRRQVDLIVNHMLELGKKSQQAGVVLDIVAELAEQTNILAINAAIEATGAGESGRRFGVIADEIRKLADRVTSSTKSIRAILDDVRGAVTVTVMATETGSKAVDAGAVQVAAMAQAFRDITGMVGLTVDAAREIELSTKQQASAVEQVNVAISSVTQATRETETSATQTLQTSLELTTLSGVLTRLVQRPA
jgi:CHASE3 domain sensor protein